MSILNAREWFLIYVVKKGEKKFASWSEAKAMNIWRKPKFMMPTNNRLVAQIAILIFDLYIFFVYKTAKWSFIDVSCMKYIFTMMRNGLLITYQPMNINQNI